MMEDSRLTLFADRLCSHDEHKEDLVAELISIQFGYQLVLDKVAYEFNKVLPLPFEDRVQKKYPGFVQLHWPAQNNGEMAELGMHWSPEEWSTLYPAETKLGEWLMSHADEIADRFVCCAKYNNLEVLYKLELPAGVRGALFVPPFRLVWDYWIATDSYVARFDLVGKVKS